MLPEQSRKVVLLLENQTVDILALNETRLHPDIPSDFVNIGGYDMVRMDRVAVSVFTLGGPYHI